VDRAQLERLDAFADLPADEIDELAAVMNHVEVAAGTELITYGKDGYLIYFVEQGEADVVNDDNAVLRSVGPGDTFGEIAILTDGTRTATVVARTDISLFTLFEFDFESIRARVPEFEGSLRRLGSERL
jgi:CRP-like cAMP-binding protein